MLIYFDPLGALHEASIPSPCLRSRKVLLSRDNGGDDLYSAQIRKRRGFM